MERFVAGELYPIKSGDPRGRWAPDGEGNVSIWAKNGELSIVAAGLKLALDQLVGDEPSVSVEAGDGRPLPSTRSCRAMNSSMRYRQRLPGSQPALAPGT
jgi:hypothetical protein